MNEAVYIVDEKKGSVHFQNRTANKLTVQLTADTKLSLLDNDNQFDFSRESFAEIDKKVFKAKQKEADAENAEKVLASEDYVSMREIINTQMSVTPDKRVKQLFRINPDKSSYNERNFIDSTSRGLLLGSLLESGPGQEQSEQQKDIQWRVAESTYLSVRVKRQMYGGHQATVIYIINETKKIRAKFKDIKHS